MTASQKQSKPILTVDAVVISVDEQMRLNVLLIERKWGVFAGMMALPGGIVDYPETAEDAVKRELEEETSVVLEDFCQLKTFSNPKRDAEKYSVSVAFLALTRASEHTVKGGDDAKNAQWVSLDSLPSLAFDHEEIVAIAKKQLRHLAYLGIVGCFLLPHRVSLPDLHALHQNFFSTAPDVQKFIKSGILSIVDEGKGIYQFNYTVCSALLHSCMP